MQLSQVPSTGFREQDVILLIAAPSKELQSKSAHWSEKGWERRNQRLPHWSAASSAGAEVSGQEAETLSSRNPTVLLVTGQRDPQTFRKQNLLPQSTLRHAELWGEIVLTTFRKTQNHLWRLGVK